MDVENSDHSDFSEEKLISPEIKQTNLMDEKLLPEKSKEKYLRVFKNFEDWRKKKKVKSLSETVFLAYFGGLAKTHAPSSLWAIYSMLRSTVHTNYNININSYDKLMAFLKQNSKGFKSKKSSILPPDKIHKFLIEAPDCQYLAIKTILVFGIAGLCKREELYNLKVEDLEDKGYELEVRISKTKTNTSKSFIIADEFYEIYKRYAVLRPATISRFFLRYSNGKCINQAIGINTFGSIPKIIAKYLKLPDPAKYTGHSFRRSSASILADSGVDILTLKRVGGWKSKTVTEEYADKSLCMKRKLSNQIIKAIIPEIKPEPSMSPSSPRSPIFVAVPSPPKEYDSDCGKSSASFTSSTSIDYDINDKVPSSSKLCNIKNKETPLLSWDTTNFLHLSLERLSYTYRGLIVPVFTPFNSDGSLNLNIIPQYATYLAKKGINGILVNGTSGEGMLMSVAERKLITEAWVEAVKETKQHLMIQVGGAPLPDVIELAKHSNSLHVDSILCLPELYFKPTTPNQLIEYLEIVGKAAPNIPLLYYHIPMITNVNIHMGQFLESIGNKIPSFVGIKFTSTNLEEGSQALRANNRKYVIFFGNDQLISAGCALGMDSFIVTSINMFPEFILDLVAVCKNEDVLRAKDMQEKLSRAVVAIIKHGDWVQTMKTAMTLLTGIDIGLPRPPLKSISSTAVAIMTKDLMNLGYQLKI